MLPEELKEMLMPVLGDDVEKLDAAMAEEPSVSIRRNRRKPMRIPLAEEGEPVRWCEDGVYLPSRPLFTLDPLLHAGAYYVQDASSMIHQQIAQRIMERPDMKARTAEGIPLRVLDLCAAPGGKTTALVNALPDGTLIVANEIDRQRCAVLRENLEKWGYPDTIVTNSDAASLGQLEGIFDIIAVDAPCSGEGMMRKDSDALTQWTPSLTASCARLQARILDEILPALRPGGYLIYSTCTFNTLEDEEILRQLTGRHGMEPVSLPLQGTETVLHGLDSDIPSLRFMPHATRGEGLFVGVLRKPGDSAPASLPSPSRKKNKKDSSSRPDARKRKNTTADPALWLRDTTDYTLTETGTTLHALSPSLAALHAAVSDKARVVGAGIPVADIKGDLLVPCGRLATSLAFRPDAFPRVELSEEEAIRFLRRDTLILPPETPRGYVTVTYAGLPLGFLKNIGNRTNNLLPQSWRIRMQADGTQRQTIQSRQ